MVKISYDAMKGSMKLTDFPNTSAVPTDQLTKLGFEEIDKKLWEKRMGEGVAIYHDYRKGNRHSYGYDPNSYINIREFDEYKIIKLLEGSVGTSKLSSFDCHGHNPKGTGSDGENKMENEQISWAEALSGAFVKFEDGVRKTLVGMNPRFDKVEKQFQGQEKKEMIQLTLDIIEEDGVECEKEINTVSKRMIKGLRPLFENIGAGVAVKFSVKKIGTKTDTAFDIESV